MSCLSTTAPEKGLYFFRSLSWVLLVMCVLMYSSCSSPILAAQLPSGRPDAFRSGEELPRREGLAREELPPHRLRDVDRQQHAVNNQTYAAMTQPIVGGYYAYAVSSSSEDFYYTAEKRRIGGSCDMPEAAKRVPIAVADDPSVNVSRCSPNIPVDVGRGDDAAAVLRDERLHDEGCAQVWKSALTLAHELEQLRIRSDQATVEGATTEEDRTKDKERKMRGRRHRRLRSRQRRSSRLGRAPTSLATSPPWLEAAAAFGPSSYFSWDEVRKHAETSPSAGIDGSSDSDTSSSSNFLGLCSFCEDPERTTFQPLPVLGALHHHQNRCSASPERGIEEVRHACVGSFKEDLPEGRGVLKRELDSQHERARMAVNNTREPLESASSESCRSSGGPDDLAPPTPYSSEDKAFSIADVNSVHHDASMSSPPSSNLHAEAPIPFEQDVEETTARTKKVLEHPQYVAGEEQSTSCGSYLQVNLPFLVRRMRRGSNPFVQPSEELNELPTSSKRKNYLLSAGVDHTRAHTSRTAENNVLQNNDNASTSTFVTTHRVVDGKSSDRGLESPQRSETLSFLPQSSCKTGEWCSWRDAQRAWSNKIFAAFTKGARGASSGDTFATTESRGASTGSSEPLLTSGRICNGREGGPEDCIISTRHKVFLAPKDYVEFSENVEEHEGGNKKVSL
ncbi:unnamed protein product [Amoebophrya sp. A25]|nr:unnamed protein product [Amoebophrya sp. A25]|eukprot:GSA25T00013178001.1